MKKEFTPGMYCKFPNEEIPRILDILRANGYRVWGFKKDFSDCMCIMYDGDEFIPNQEPDDHELSRHDFMVKALRLEEGMEMQFEESTQEQRQYIHNELLKLGVSVYEENDYSVESGYPNLYFDGDHITGRSSFGIGGNFIPYLDWCQRLCVEPIGLTIEDDSDLPDWTTDSHELMTGRSEPVTNEPVFDPLKPFQVRHPDLDWHNKGKHYYYVGQDRDGRHVIQDNVGSFEAWRQIRNTEEFNASMLNRGECMIIDDVENPQWKGFVLAKTDEGNFYCMEGDESHKGVLFAKGHKVKGHPVDVEIKVISDGKKV